MLRYSSIAAGQLAVLLLIAACSHKPPPPASPPVPEASVGTSSGLTVPAPMAHPLSPVKVPVASRPAEAPVHPNWWLLGLALLTFFVGTIGGYLLGRRRSHVATQAAN